MNQLIDFLRAEVRADFNDDATGHDLSHLDRVHGLAIQLAEDEGGNQLVIAAGCYLHDLHRVVERRTQRFDQRVARRHIDELIEMHLRAVRFPHELIERVCDCVAFTDRYSFSGDDLADPSIEAQVLRDADNLDAMGAIGIARAFMFGGALGEPIWVDGVTPSGTYAAGKTTSVIHHFYEKLLRLQDDMLTVSGRRLAEQRHSFMLMFVEQLRSEWLHALDTPRIPSEPA
jgi:uncharacterized protein